MTPAKEVEDTVEELWNEYAVPHGLVVEGQPKLRVASQMTDESTGYVFVDLEEAPRDSFDWGP